MDPDVFTDAEAERRRDAEAERWLRGRVFWLVRDVDITGISGTGVVADGVQFPDGTVVMRWCAVDNAHAKRGVKPTTQVHDDLESAIALHGHNGATRIVWVDSPPGG